MGMVWGSLVGIIYWLIKRDKQGAIVVGLCVLSHWFLDLIVHVPDLPLSPFGDFKGGLGLCNNVAAALIIETIIFITGVYIYATFTKAKNKIGNWALRALVIFLLVFDFYNTFGPTPPDSIMILFVSSIVLMGLIISIAYWVDKNREVAL
jgi:hypothetical protein